MAGAGRYALACFLCHQAAEKAVTAYLLARGAEGVWGHALADLCEDAMALDPSFDFIKSVAGLLDKHYLGARYPSALPGASRPRPTSCKTPSGPWRSPGTCASSWRSASAAGRRDQARSGARGAPGSLRWSKRPRRSRRGREG